MQCLVYSLGRGQSNIPILSKMEEQTSEAVCPVLISTPNITELLGKKSKPRSSLKIHISLKSLMPEGEVKVWARLEKNTTNYSEIKDGKS